MRISDWSSDVCSSDLGELQMPISGIGVARLPRGDRLRLRSPGGEALRGRSAEQQRGSEYPLDRRLYLRPHRLDDLAKMDDAGRTLVDRFEIVADRLLARDVREGAEDGGEEARRFGFAGGGAANAPDTRLRVDVEEADRKSTSMNYRK